MPSERLYKARRSDAGYGSYILSRRAHYARYVTSSEVALLSSQFFGIALRSRIVKEVNGRWTEIYSAPLLEYVTFSFSNSLMYS